MRYYTIYIKNSLLPNKLLIKNFITQFCCRSKEIQLQLPNSVFFLSKESALYKKVDSFVSTLIKLFALILDFFKVFKVHNPRICYRFLIEKIGSKFIFFLWICNLITTQCMCIIDLQTFLMNRDNLSHF